jgi:hypothetical protein
MRLPLAIVIALVTSLLGASAATADPTAPEAPRLSCVPGESCPNLCDAETFLDCQLMLAGLCELGGGVATSAPNGGVYCD